MPNAATIARLQARFDEELPGIVTIEVVGGREVSLHFKRLSRDEQVRAEVLKIVDEIMRGEKFEGA